MFNIVIAPWRQVERGPYSHLPEPPCPLPRPHTLTTQQKPERPGHGAVLSLVPEEPSLRGRLWRDCPEEQGGQGRAEGRLS